MPDPIHQLRAAVDAASGAIAGEGAQTTATPTLDRPKQADFGDYATNAAMLLAKVMKSKPRDIAEQLAPALTDQLGPSLDRVEIAGPGFINLFLSDAWHADALTHILEAGDRFGAATASEPQKYLVEFVSANPTGPMTAAGGRHAAYGDALARLLEFSGHKVSREYYVNDYGSQVRRLGESIQARAKGEEPPEDGYKGEYVAELAAEIPDAATGDVDAIAAKGVELLLQRIRASMEAIRVDFDVYFSEKSLHDGSPSEVDQAFAVLDERGETFREEGALWLRTTAHGDDKDRVIERSTGEHTYFASDIAYHLDKRERGFERLVDVWGADHHGYVPRMRAMFAALGQPEDALEMVIMQFVNIVGGQMSKREGRFVTLDELLEKIGPDAARFLMLQRSHDTTVDLDLDLAVKQSNDNPVYYVQYAHARIASMRRKAAEGEFEAALADGSSSVPTLQPAERALVQKLLAFPEEVSEATERRAPHRIANYALELGQVYARFYEQCPVLKADDDIRPFRLRLSVATQRTVARSLDLLGVSAPESM